mmetsp:Transcript_3764/g.23671  ORF Transcript_3764/g.23671 Transcript_3764/m.23671 type:complete len:321 (+) Transcript_3764:1916-2878(+)
MLHPTGRERGRSSWRSHARRRGRHDASKRGFSAADRRRRIPSMYLRLVCAAVGRRTRRFGLDPRVSHQPRRVRATCVARVRRGWRRHGRACARSRLRRGLPSRPEGLRVRRSCRVRSRLVSEAASDARLPVAMSPSRARFARARLRGHLSRGQSFAERTGVSDATCFAARIGPGARRARPDGTAGAWLVGWKHVRPWRDGFGARLPRRRIHQRIGGIVLRDVRSASRSSMDGGRHGCVPPRVVRRSGVATPPSQSCRLRRQRRRRCRPRRAPVRQAAGQARDGRGPGGQSIAKHQRRHRLGTGNDVGRREGERRVPPKRR